MSAMDDATYRNYLVDLGTLLREGAGRAKREAHAEGSDG
jgi:hypothetical protein